MNTTNNLTTAVAFTNLFNAIKAKKETSFSEFTKELSEATELSKILDTWRFNDLLPTSKKGYQWNLEELKAYLLNRKQKQINKELSKELADLQRISEAGEILSISISVEWKKSKMWGSNPSAEAKIETTKGYFYYVSGSIGGCGYDKGSKAVANVLNQCDALKNMLYAVKESQPNIDNRDLFSYGAGYGILPSIEGGVGVSCYDRIFNKIGFNFKSVASGKSFDVYSITKI